jgi:hypothetical protein
MRTHAWWWLVAALALTVVALACDDAADDDTSVTDDDDDSDDDDDDDTTAEQPAGCLGQPGPVPGPDLCAEDAPCRWDGRSANARFGFSIAAGRDLTGDGVPDFAVGSRGYTEIDQEGQVLLYSGAVATEDPPPDPAVFVGLQPLAFTGFSIALVQDMDGDGFDDLVAGGTGVEDIADLELSPNVGAAYLISGGVTLEAGGDEVTLEPATTFYGESYYARVGWAMADAGDVNGDGLGDLLLSGELQDYDSENYEEIYRQGRGYLVFGRAGGFPETMCLDEADVRLDGDEASEMAGEALAGGHDLDGDGVLGAPYNHAAGSYAGRAYVVSGDAVTGGGDLELADAGVIVADAEAYDCFGWSVASVGDLTGDGLGEFAVGSPGHDGGGYNSGALVLYPGSAQLASGVAPDPLTTISGEWPEHDYGLRAIGADVDGDGARDLLVSAIYAHERFAGRLGRIYVYQARDAAGWASVVTADQSDADYTGAGVSDYMGFGLGAADLDLDGTDDLLLGSAYHDTSDAADIGRVYVFWGGPF